MSGLLPEQWLNKWHSYRLIVLNGDDSGVLLKLISDDQGYERKYGIEQYGDLRQDLKNLREQNLRHRVVSQINPAKVFSFSRIYPASAAEHIDALAQTEISKSFPFSEEPIVHASSVSKVGETGNKISANHFVVKRALIDQVQEFYENIDLEPDGYVFSNNEASAVFIKKHLRNRLWRRDHRQNIRAIGAVILGLMVLLFSLSSYQNRVIDAYKVKIDGLETRSKALRIKEDRLAKIHLASDAIRRVKTSSPTFLKSWKELVEILPQSVELTEMEFSDQDLQLQGRAVGPESLISILEKSELFSDAEFSSSITKDAKTGREKFNISVKLKTDGI